MRCVIPIRLVTDPAWVPGHVSSNEPVPQASPTTSEAHGNLGSIDYTEEGLSYDKCGSQVTIDTVE